MKTIKEIRSGNAHLAEIARYLLGGRKYKSSFRVWQTAKYKDLIEDFEQASRNQVIFYNRNVISLFNQLSWKHVTADADQDLKVYSAVLIDLQTVVLAFIYHIS